MGIKKCERKRGASRMLQLGYKSVTIWLDPVEVLMLKAAVPHVSAAAATKDAVLKRCHDEGQYRHIHHKAAAEAIAKSRKNL